MAELSMEVDRSSPVPLYHQIALQLEAAIVDGELPSGARLENETDLARRWGLSRPTLRRAIQELVAKGMLVRRRGIGTQVVNHGHGGVKRQLQLTSLYDDLERAGRNPTTDVLVHRFTSADDEIAGLLGLEVGDNILYLERVRNADGEPLALMRNWLPAELAATFTRGQLTDGGLYALFRSKGVSPRIAWQRVGARGTTAEEGRALSVRKGTCALTMERMTYDDTGRAVELGRHVYRADLYSFEVMVVDR
jgi:DNA-binding GntR family transcriptional regulator